MRSKMLCLLVVVLLCSLNEVSCRRGDKFLSFFITPKPRPTKLFRIPRHHKWRMNYADNDHHDDFTTTPETTTTTTTKSPEQIKLEKEEQMRKENPKGFAAIESVENLNKDATEAPLIEQINKMKEKLDFLETTCVKNTDCTNKTCCMIGSKGLGKCVLRPYKTGDVCSDLCACTGSLHCRLLEVDQEDGNITLVNKCSDRSKVIKGSQSYGEYKYIELMKRLGKAKVKKKQQLKQQKQQQQQQNQKQ